MVADVAGHEGAEADHHQRNGDEGRRRAADPQRGPLTPGVDPEGGDHGGETDEPGGRDVPPEAGQGPGPGRHVAPGEELVDDEQADDPSEDGQDDGPGQPVADDGQRSGQGEPSPPPLPGVRRDPAGLVGKHGRRLGVHVGLHRSKGG